MCLEVGVFLKLLSVCHATVEAEPLYLMKGTCLAPSSLPDQQGRSTAYGDSRFIDEM